MPRASAISYCKEMGDKCPGTGLQLSPKPKIGIAWLNMGSQFLY